MSAYIQSRDLRSFQIQFEFESAILIQFNSSDGPIRKFSNH